MNIQIWWDCFSGYASDCWRRLAEKPTVELNVLAIKQLKNSNTSFSEELVRGISVELSSIEKLMDAVNRRVKKFDSDVLFVSGWQRKPYKWGTRELSKCHIPKVLAFDSPWTGTVKQRLSVFLQRRYSSRFAAAVVPGERGSQYASRLGFKTVFKGLYGIEDEGLRNARVRRHSKSHWPKQFLFVGRMVEAKAIRTLASGYQRYRSMVTNPWPITCVGIGPQSTFIEGSQGVTIRGFLQPSDMVHEWAEHGVFVLPSNVEPWGQALVEACRSGLPIVHSDACGSAVELVREHFNGKSHAVGDVDGLANALVYMHSRYDSLSIMGDRSYSLAEAFTAQQWSENWLEIAKTVTGRT